MADLERQQQGEYRQDREWRQTQGNRFDTDAPSSMHDSAFRNARTLQPSLLVDEAGIPIDEESSFSPVGPLGPAPATRRARQSVVLGDIPLAGESHDAVTEDVGRVVVVLPGQEPVTRTPEEADEEGRRR